MEWAQQVPKHLISRVDRCNILLLPNDKAANVYDTFNWKYKIGGGSKIRQAMHYAAFNQNYRHGL
ncbi:unnamed protein product [Penicillium camemberti]|uniref:Str. FM013 n=1 Tax=Penicillium camemberti (strain FM 013) TaxID=1429867 RepID=A0A0G4PBK1_PENC3|nr:unnamed protein product [Penicillium camemberti]